MGGPVLPISRTSDGLAQNDGYTPRTFHGGVVKAGAACEVEIRDGSVAGTVLSSARLGAAGEIVLPLGPSERGVATANGVWVEVVSGTPTVTVFVS
ncbi:MAG: hypothetical protein WD739_07350 [Actinomycetota bacterium]